MCRLSDLLEPLSNFAKAALRNGVLRDSLAAIHGDLLKFNEKAYSVIVDARGQPKLMVSFRTFRRMQWIPFEDEFGKIEKNVAHHVEALRVAASGDILSNTIDVQENQKQQERTNVLNWLSESWYEERHQTVSSKRHEGTGDCLLQHDAFQQWSTSSSSSLMWCYGSPGAGKMVLTSNVVEYITKERALDQGVAVLFFYCDYQQQQQQETHEIPDVVCALIKQLFQATSEVAENILQAYRDSHSPSVVGNCEDFIAA